MVVISLCFNVLLSGVMLHRVLKSPNITDLANCIISGPISSATISENTLVLMLNVISPDEKLETLNSNAFGIIPTDSVTF